MMEGRMTKQEITEFVREYEEIFSVYGFASRGPKLRLSSERALEIVITQAHMSPEDLVFANTLTNKIDGRSWKFLHVSDWGGDDTIESIFDACDRFGREDLKSLFSALVL